MNSDFKNLTVNSPTFPHNNIPRTDENGWKDNHDMTSSLKSLKPLSSIPNSPLFFLFLELNTIYLYRAFCFVSLSFFGLIFNFSVKHL